MVTMADPGNTPSENAPFIADIALSLADGSYLFPVPSSLGTRTGQTLWAILSFVIPP